MKDTTPSTNLLPAPENWTVAYEIAAEGIVVGAVVVEVDAIAEAATEIKTIIQAADANAKTLPEGLGYKVFEIVCKI